MSNANQHLWDSLTVRLAEVVCATRRPALIEAFDLIRDGWTARSEDRDLSRAAMHSTKRQAEFHSHFRLISRKLPGWRVCTSER